MATVEPVAINSGQSTTSGRGVAIALGVARFATFGILVAGAIPKFFNFTDDGSKALADALGIGRLEITGLGLIELSAAILLLWPTTTARGLGAMLAVGMMTGALVSHVTTLGWSGSAPAEMWPLALVALIGGTITLVAHRRSLPWVGRRF